MEIAAQFDEEFSNQVACSHCLLLDKVTQLHNAWGYIIDQLRQAIMPLILFH